MNLLDLYEQREPYQQNIDELEYRRISDLRDKMEYLMKAYRQATTDDAKNAIMARYNEYKAEREGYAKVREQQVPGRQDPFAYVKPEPKGIGDVQDPRDKMAQLAQKSKKGALANVGAGIKAFVKGEPEPMDEQQLNPRALGNANFARLVKANMDGNLPVGLEFIRPEENFKLDQRGLDLISDYYDGLEGDPAKNYFIYRVLPSGEETLKVLRQLGYTPALALKQQSLPGIPTQGELPLQEKKKSDDLEAGDVKVARELQKLRARYPATRSDIEAVAKAEIDSTERSQQQLAAIRGANEKQDALLKQLVDLDKQQGREIDGLETENNSLEQRLASIQAMNTGLQKAIGTMGSTRPTAKVTATKPATGYADLAQGGIIDTGPDVTPAQTATAPIAKPQSKPDADVVGSMVQQLRSKPAPRSMRGDAANQPIKAAAESQVEEGQMKSQDTLRRELEHYGAKRFGQIYGMTTDEINRIKNPNTAQDMPMPAPRFRDAQGRAQLEAETDSRGLRQQLAIKYRELAPAITPGRDTYLAGQLYDALEDIAQQHGAMSEFRKIMDSARNRAHMEYDTNPGGFHNWFQFLPFADEQGVAEAVKEPTTRRELLDRIDRIQRMMTQDRNPANVQIMKKDIELLKQRYQHLKEDIGNEAVEIAIMRRILIQHTDLIQTHGLDRVTQAIEDVAEDVGEVDEIGSSDVSAYVRSVMRDLEPDADDLLREKKWSGKYKSSINCGNPKGFSQKAHCAGKKK